jgi:lipid-A-disaccharide synthase
MDGGEAFELGVVAAEASGDLLAASVLDGLQARLPATGLRAAGIGGPALQARGMDCWWSIDALSVRGYVEVLREYPRLLRLRRDLRERLQAWRPDVFLGVDAPDFNLDLEVGLRRAGVPTAHFIGPSVWAWRRGRLARIREAAGLMLLVFPFEQAIYDEAGIPAVYVGHPLADQIPPKSDRAGARRALGLPPEAPLVALLPGSRPAEIRYMAESFLETARWLRRARPELRFVLPAAGARQYEQLRALLARRGIDDSVLLTEGRSHEALAACDTALVGSGTATLEAALFGRPMVIAYRMAGLSYAIMRRMGYLPWIGLPNILCRDWVVPEFVQAAATPAAMGQALLEQLDDPALRERITGRFADLHGTLRRDCATRCAEELLAYAERMRAGRPARGGAAVS